MKVVSQEEVRKVRNWVAFKPSLCKGCWAGCCTLPVRVSPEDLYHMGYLTLMQVNGPLKRVAATLKRKGIVKSFNAHNRVFILAQKNGSDCVFLDDNRRCTIYENRPHVCREFPANSARPGFCPGHIRAK